MAEITVEKNILHPDHTSLLYQAKEGDVEQSKGRFFYVNTWFGKDLIKTMTAGGVATPPQYRRGGNVRKIFEKAHQTAAEDGVVSAILHPFSFAYYENFGYGKVADHLIARCPIRLMDFVERCNDLVLYTGSPEQLEDLLTIYNEFIKGRTLMRQRYNETFWKKETTYIYYEDGKPTGYIMFSTEKTLRINHYEDGLMTVHETVYNTPKALRAILGFIRMYEGELDDVEFAHLEVCPEVQLLLRHHTHTSFRLLPDMMARILNTEAILNVAEYPQQEGTFRICVEDTYPLGKGSFQVDYGKGEAVVKRLADSAEVDLTLSMSAFSRFVYGYDGIGVKEAKFMDGVSVDGKNADDFFRAFPKRFVGAFEHF